MPSMGWLRDLFVEKFKEEAEKPTQPWICEVIYGDGFTDTFHLWATDAKDAMALTKLWMPMRESPAVELRLRVKE